MSSDSKRGAVSRRTVLKVAGATSAAALITSETSQAEAFSLLRQPEVLPDQEEVPSFCEVCFWNCGLIASKHNNEVLALRGHPDSPPSNGKLCARGNAGIDFIRNEARLKYPMVRVGERGEGRFKRVGWTTAYKLIAKAFNKIKKKHGPESVALLFHGTSGYWPHYMLTAFGSANQAEPAFAQCLWPREVGFRLTYGTGIGSPEPMDFENTKCMVFFGSHLGENAHNSQTQEFVKAKARGAKLIVLDPRMSTPAGRADLWLPIKPGSDTAVMLAWMHLLIKNETYHQQFVENQCSGFAELAEHVKNLTPEWASKQAGIPAADIVKAYEMMAAAKPAVVIHPGRHTVWYGEADTQRARAQAILNALLGSWWAKGGMHKRLKPPPLGDFPGPNFPDAKHHVDEAAERYPFSGEATTTGIRDATRTGKPYPIKGWYVHATNPLQSLPNIHETIEAIKQLDILVVSDIQQSEIVQWADIVLPEDTYLERYDDIKRSSGKVPYLAIRQPVVKSRFDTRPGWRIAKELGKELGLGDFFAFDTFEEYLTARLKGTGVSLAELKKKGIVHTKPKDPNLYMDPSKPRKWKTKSGKVELFSHKLKEHGFDPMPVYKPQPEPGPGTFRLLYGRSPVQTFGRTSNLEILHDMHPGNCLWIHPDDAAKLHIEPGQPVMVSNDKGDETGPLPAKVTERIAPGCVYMIHGFGHTSKGLHLAYGMGGNDTKLIRNYAVDPITGSTGMRTQFVSVRPSDTHKEMYPCDMG